MNTKHITLTEEQFDEQYHVLPNHITGNTSFGGMYETYGDELEHIIKLMKDPDTCRKVWTIMEADGNLFYSSGYHLINRIGYLVTKENVPEDTHIDVELEDLCDHDGEEDDEDEDEIILIN